MVITQLDGVHIFKWYVPCLHEVTCHWIRSDSSPSQSQLPETEQQVCKTNVAFFKFWSSVPSCFGRIWCIACLALHVLLFDLQKFKTKAALISNNISHYIFSLPIYIIYLWLYQCSMSNQSEVTDPGCLSIWHKLMKTKPINHGHAYHCTTNWSPSTVLMLQNIMKTRQPSFSAWKKMFWTGWSVSGDSVGWWWQNV